MFSDYRKEIVYCYWVFFVLSSLTWCIVQAVAAMVEECCKFVDQTPDRETKIKLIDTLRTVSEGKVRKSSLSKACSVATIFFPQK